jgi:hypothetical protein
VFAAQDFVPFGNSVHQSRRMPCQHKMLHKLIAEEFWTLPATRLSLKRTF